jgi:hypothetical protein
MVNWVAPAVEVRLGGQRWADPAHRELDSTETHRTLVAAYVHAIAFTPGRQ